MVGESNVRSRLRGVVLWEARDLWIVTLIDGRVVLFPSPVSRPGLKMIFTLLKNHKNNGTR